VSPGKFYASRHRLASRNIESMDERSNYERLTIPTIWVAFALSFLIHALGLFGWIPKVRESTPFQEPRLGKPSQTLAIRLVPLTAPTQNEAPSPPPRAPAPAAQTATRKVHAPKARAVEPQRLPRIPPLDRPSPIVAPPPAEATAPAPVPAAGDLASYVASRRRARGEAPELTPQPATPVETEQQRHNRVVAENLGLTKTPTFGSDPNRGDGVFVVRDKTLDFGKFTFYGWNKAIKRDSLQEFEVRLGNNENMEIAMVRRMIVIIRELSDGDFLWQSRKLNKGVWLSARPKDNAELEAFMLFEIFSDSRAR
jgi:hypothetical protein